MALRPPADIARETLKLLAARRLTPTPANYQSVYEEVAGLLPQVSFPQTPLRRIASILPTQTPVQKRLAQSFQQAVESQDWTALQSAIVDYAQLDLGITPQPPVTHTSPATQIVDALPASTAQQLARMVEAMRSVLGSADQRMRELSDQLLEFLADDDLPLPRLEAKLHNYSYRLNFTAEDQAQRRHCIHALLRMVCTHIADIARQDASLQQHAQALTDAITQPWTLQQLDTIQSCLKNLLFRHLEIEGNRSQVHEQLKQLLGEHAVQMSRLGQLSEAHASALQSCAQQIQQSQDLGELASMLEAVVSSGTALATENRMVQAQLADLRAQAESQEQKILELSTHLQEIQQITRHDAATGAFNLAGLEEALATEQARNQRHHFPLSLACLEVDPPQDPASPVSMQADDAALMHLARLVRSTLRPQDALGRTSDHRLAVIFPETDPTQAAQALARLQMALQQRPLLLDEQVLPQSFSAGVIAVQHLEAPQHALERAQAACEQAQRMGRARVSIF